MTESRQQRGAEARKWGTEAEEIAVRHLFAEGYAVRERNWKGPGNVEIDIIAEKDFWIVFVEVKARKGDHQQPLEAVDSKKRSKMVRGANMYMAQFTMDYQFRFDIITIIGTQENYRLDHLEDAFLPPLNGKW